MSSNARDVFVSHSSKDKRIADLVVSAFEERGITCWVAPRDIPGGSSWPLAIPPAIRESRCFLLIFSGSSDASDDVLNEITIASRARRPIIPFRIEDIQPDRLSYFLERTHWVDAALAPIEEHLEKLGDGVIGVLSTTPDYTPPTRRPSPPETPKSRPVSAADRLRAHEEREARHLEFLEAARAEFVDCEKLDGYMTTPAPDKMAAWQGYLEHFAEANHEIDHAQSRLEHWKTYKLALPGAEPPALPASLLPRSSPGDRMELTLPGGVAMAFRWCPPGSFMMGSPSDEASRSSDEDPVQVNLSRGFWMAETAVTQTQWRAVMGTNPSAFRGDSLPVECVSWHEAMEFSSRLSSASGVSLSLPTQAQWEYACRAGSTTPFHFGSTITPEQVNYNGNYPYGLAPVGAYRKQTTPVGSFPANAWGLRDMHGNVWEWCADWYGASLPGGTEPTGPSTGTDRVIRGGSWDGNAQICRSAYRSYSDPSSRGSRIGFRVVVMVQ